MKQLMQMITDLQKTTSSNNKKSVLKQYPENQVILKYVYNPYYQFHITSKNIIKFAKTHSIDDSTEFELSENGFLELLDTLRHRSITGHEALRLTASFVELYSLEYGVEYKEILYRCIDKNLKCRIDSKLINKVYPCLIPIFDVCLAKKFDDFQDKVYLSVDKWYVSRKLDGLRLVTIIDGNGDVKLMSRAGKEYLTLDGLREQIKSFGLTNVVFDGEVVWMDGDTDNFGEIHSRIRVKDKQIPLDNIVYFVFDFLTTQEFDSKTSDSILTERWGRFDALDFEGSNISVLNQQLVTSMEDLTNKLQTVSSELKWEGLILRKDTIYEGKRTNNLLKCKVFQDGEFTVQDVIVSEQELFVHGEHLFTEALSSVVIEYKGNTVNIGSGWTAEQRVYYAQKPEDIIGKVITVCYKKESRNKNGGYSLQFPTLKAIHGEERTE